MGLGDTPHPALTVSVDPTAEGRPVVQDEALLDLIAANNEGALAVVKGDGYPQLSNIYYIWDPVKRIARISTTEDRVKARVLRRDPHAALYVRGPHFFAWAVAEGDAEISDVTRTPGDATARELLPIYELLDPGLDEDATFARMIEERRLTIRLHVKRVYGVALPADPRG
jgi:PPOX class probable F420-dependent enzyme